MKLNSILPLGFVAIASTLMAKQTTKPNILLILSDDQSAPYLSCYGNPNLQTPNIDRIAQEGMRFDRAYVTAPQCAPSRGSIITGRNVLDIQMLRFSAPLDRSIISGPERLREVGYFTGLCGRTYHLDGMGNLNPAAKATFEKYKMVTFPDRVDYCKVNGNPDSTMAQFNEFLNRVPKGKPFFLQTCFSDPHRVFTAQNYEPDPAKLVVPHTFPDTKQLRVDLAAHIGEIQRLDEYIGKILKELEKRNLDKNTFVVFISDNGAALLRGKGTLYDLGIHIPMVARWPGVIKPGSVCNQLISCEDLVPTFLTAAGIKPPKDITGYSFMPILKGDTAAIRDYVFASRGPHGSNLPTTTNNPFDHARVVFDKQYKLIYNPMFALPYSPIDCNNDPFWLELIELHKKGLVEPRFNQTVMFSPMRPMFELFDTNTDPGEFVNLAGKTEYEVVENRLKAVLNEWMIVYRDVVALPLK
jgi:N-sulfoglucosamine sulfohydrolase